MEVKVRTPAGITAPFRFAEAEFVAAAMAQAVAHFVEHNQLAAGDYSLAVARDGRIDPMLDTARIGDYQLTDGTELHLVNEAPQVDPLEGHRGGVTRSGHHQARGRSGSWPPALPAWPSI